MFDFGIQAIASFGVPIAYAGKFSLVEFRDWTIVLVIEDWFDAEKPHWNYVVSQKGGVLHEGL